MRKFWNIVRNEDTEENEIRIDGDIGESMWGWLFDIDEVTAKSFRNDLKQFDGKDITLWINSPGGSVFEASQIYTALMEHKGDVTVKIDGTAISAASVIAMAGTRILMSPPSIIMIHNPMTMADGEEKDMKQAAKLLKEVKDTIINAYELKTGLSRDKISKLMDDETWMSAKKAVELGFADEMMYEGKEETEDVLNSRITGARLVFNSYPRPNLKDIYKAPNKPTLVDLYKQKQRNLRRKEKYGF